MILSRLEIEQEFIRMLFNIDHNKFKGIKAYCLHLENIMIIVGQDKTQNS
jgi:GTP cyclohydrolase II